MTPNDFLPLIAEIAHWCIAFYVVKTVCDVMYTYAAMKE